MPFEIFLNDESAHRMADEDWRRRQSRRDCGDVLDIVGDARPPQSLAPFAFAMASQT